MLVRSPDPSRLGTVSRQHFLLAAQMANMAAIGIWPVVFLSKPAEGDRHRPNAQKYREMMDMLKQQNEMAGKISEGADYAGRESRRKATNQAENFAFSTRLAGM